MPSIAQQLRADRQRRERRRRVTVSLLVAVPTVLLGARLVADTSANLASATSADGVTGSTFPTSSTIPTTSIAPTTTTAATGLRPGLVDAYERARDAAAAAGHRLTITSGFRTAAEQAAMLDAEVAKRGSLAEARWWVFPPDESMHVQGLAIDVGDGPAADWLVDRGARFGLCRTLDWEWWHVEWRQRWEDAGACPAPAQTPEDAPRP